MISSSFHVASHPNSTPYNLRKYRQGCPIDSGSVRVTALCSLRWETKLLKTFQKFKLFRVRSIKNSNAKNTSLFELNEKVLRSSFKMNFGV